MAWHPRAMMTRRWGEKNLIPRMDFFISDWIVLFHHLPFHTLAHKMQHQQSKFSSLFYHFETVCPSGLSAAPGPDSGWNWKYCRESVISELYWNCFMYSNSIPGCHDEWMKRWVHNNTSGTTSRGWGGEGEVGGEMPVKVTRPGLV